MKIAQKLKPAANRITYHEFVNIVPHPVVIQSLVDRYPVIIEGVSEVAEKREALGKLIPSL